MHSPNLNTHPRSFWTDRTPSFDGIHAKTLPLGWMLQNNAFEDYQVQLSPLDNEKHWKKVDPALWETNQHPIYIAQQPTAPPEVEIVSKRPRGRPRKEKKAYILRNPSPWQLFVKEKMPTLVELTISSQEKVKHLAKLWAERSIYPITP